MENGPHHTTIHQPIELIAEAALGFLVSRIADAALPAREVTIDAPLIRRGPTELGPDGDYGFLDLAAKKTRVLFLNTTSTGAMGKGISRAQTA
ncbi:MAG: hypothetical protein PHV28_13030, partial [Kiritimatiellae bacterium]|nr:hypothetical protein [Kiritimatiellia bacterium]